MIAIKSRVNTHIHINSCGRRDALNSYLNFKTFKRGVYPEPTARNTVICVTILRCGNQPRPIIIIPAGIISLITKRLWSAIAMEMRVADSSIFVKLSLRPARGLAASLLAWFIGERSELVRYGATSHAECERASEVSTCTCALNVLRWFSFIRVGGIGPRGGVVKRPGAAQLWRRLNAWLSLSLMQMK